VASLVFSQAGFGADRTAQGELSQAEADSLVRAVEALAASKVQVVEQGSPPVRGSSGAAVTAKWVILTEPTKPP